MSQIACSHCGFQNFAISAYCGRCESPLTHRQATTNPETKPIYPSLLESQQTLVRKPASQPITVRPALAAVPPPGPPQLEPATPAPLPITVPVTHGQQAQTQTHVQVPVQTANVRVALAGLPRLLFAHAIDFGVLCIIGCAIAACEALIFDDTVAIRNSDLMYWLAHWLHTHPWAALHGLIAGSVVGIILGARSTHGDGRTLGQRITGIVVIKANGQPTTWPYVILRTTVALASSVALGAGFFWSIVDDKRRSWHDLFAGTITVRHRVLHQKSS